MLKYQIQKCKLIILCFEELIDAKQRLSPAFLGYRPQLISCIDQLLVGNLTGYIIYQKRSTSHEGHVCHL